jgi:GTPase SAR1 family protein
MISTYYRGANAAIIVYDFTNINSFYSLKNWLREVKQFAPDNCIKYLVCNKVDKFSPNTTNISHNWMISDAVKKLLINSSIGG